MRDFLHPRGDTRAESIESRSPIFRKSQAGVVPPGVHRFSRKVSWIRLIPSYRAAAHRVAIEMGSPYPSTLKAPRVDVTVNGGRTESFTLGREIQSYELDADAEPGAPIVIRIDSPIWSRAGERASQGVRVDRVTVSPVDPM